MDPHLSQSLISHSLLRAKLYPDDAYSTDNDTATGGGPDKVGIYKSSKCNEQLAHTENDAADMVGQDKHTSTVRQDAVNSCIRPYMIKTSSTGGTSVADPIRCSINGKDDLHEDTSPEEAFGILDNKPVEKDHAINDPFAHGPWQVLLQQESEYWLTTRVVRVLLEVIPHSSPLANKSLWKSPSSYPSMLPLLNSLHALHVQLKRTMESQVKKGHGETFLRPAS